MRRWCSSPSPQPPSLVECWIGAFFQIGLFHGLGGHITEWRWTGRRALELLRESWPEMASQLVLVLLYRIDTIMVKAMQGDAAAGVYGAAVRVSEVLYFLPIALSGVALPQLIELQKRNRALYEKRFADYFAVSILMAFAGAGLLWLAAEPAIHALWKARFSGSAAILAIHAWAFIPYCLGVARTQYLTAESAVGQSAQRAARAHHQCRAELAVDSEMVRRGRGLGHARLLHRGSLGVHLIPAARCAPRGGLEAPQPEVQLPALLAAVLDRSTRRLENERMKNPKRFHARDTPPWSLHHRCRRPVRPVRHRVHHAR